MPSFNRLTHRTIGKLSLITLVIALTGCDSMHKLGQHVTNPNTVCTPSAAYGQGFQDGRRALAVHSDFAATCPTNNLTIDDAYRSGYLAGQASQH